MKNPLCPKDSPDRDLREEHHMLLHDSITRITLDLIASGSEIVTLKKEKVDLQIHADRCEVAWGTAVQQKNETHQEVLDLTAEVDALKELQVAAEAITGPAEWFSDNIKPEVQALHKAIRKVRGMT